MLAKNWMMATGSVLVLGAMLAPSVMAQTADDTIETIVVTGIRGSLEKSAAIKRDSKQIVDVITAEDVGKLPDNNVPEALARVTGVQIERSHGQGSSVTIRGLSDIQTTVNGADVSSGTDRSMSLSDIPAELLKSVEVYKTRSADQVEGGIAGTVNVDLRRPLDLDFGWTVAGSARTSNSSIGNTWSPYLSLLVADRTDTPLGEMGFLINLSYTQNNYFENYIESESPMTFYSGSYQVSSLPASQQGLLTPYAINYGVEQGMIIQPAVNISTQWKISDNLDVVLEGSYMSSKDKVHRDRLHLTIPDGNFVISNATVNDAGSAFKSFTETSYDGTSTVNGGPQSWYDRTGSDQFTTNFETHWHNGHWQINTATQYNWSSYKFNEVGLISRFPGATSVNVDFDSDNVPGGGPFMEFIGVDTSDVSETAAMQLHDEVSHNKSQQLSTQTDVTYQVSDDWYIRNIQFGVRYTHRHNSRDYGYRDATLYSDSTKTSYLAMSDFPSCGSDTSLVHMDVSGVKSVPSWNRISASCILKNYDAIRSYIEANSGTNGTVSTSNDWSTSEPGNNSLSQVYTDHENTFGGYVQTNYAFNAFFPIDGLIGVRVVKTWADTSSYKFSYDTSWNETITETGGVKNYTDVLPSGNGIIHFTDKLQLRLSYYFNVQRPPFYESSAWDIIQTSGKTVYRGNPTLKPMTEHNYDASLEYFFGKAGQLSLGYFLKKPHGWMYYDGRVDTDTSSSTYGYTIYTNRNSGPGTFEGFEFTAQSFFDFLPGFWSNFGASANATLMSSYKILYPYASDVSGISGVYDAENTSRYTYNLALYYDTPEISARLAYNYRAKWRTYVYTSYPEYSPYNDAVSRLDAALNYTPVKYVTFSLEGTNLLEENNRTMWGKSGLLPLGLRMQARTIQLSARFRY